jgi:hypothetical protein
MKLPAEWDEGAALIALGRRLHGVWTRETTIRLEKNLRNIGYNEISYIILGWDEVGKDDLAFTESATHKAYIWQPSSIEEALAIMARYDMIISCKLHGIIAAALLHKRAKVLSGDNKFLSLCLAIPRISMDDFILQFREDDWKLREIEKGDYLYVPEIIISQAKSEFNRALASIFNRESSDKRQP